MSPRGLARGGRLPGGHETVLFTPGALSMHVSTSANSAICPDLLDHHSIGVADNMRGRVVRAFFWLMRLWPAR